MGGFAFASGPHPLRTPRMPSAVYLAVKSRCETILKLHYAHVATPIEGPGKKDFGDVDFLVALPTQLLSSHHDDSRTTVETLGKALGAVRIIPGPLNNPTVNFALPWPKEFRHQAAAGDNVPPNEEIFVQVDIHVCKDKDEWDWKVFQHAHGDLRVIVGSIIRSCGLTVNDVGLFLRIKEIERLDRKRSMVLLTKCPSDMLSFLGLDESLWWQPFESVEAMFEFVASCRYFWVDDAVKEKYDEIKPLKAKERKSMKRRTCFKKWVEEFIPQCRASDAFKSPVHSREQVREEAFDRFKVKDAYDQKLDTWRRDMEKAELRKKLSIIKA